MHKAYIIPEKINNISCPLQIIMKCSKKYEKCSFNDVNIFVSAKAGGRNLVL